MKQVFVDTNIVIDLLAKRESFYQDAARLFSMADRGELRIMVSALTIANTQYILRRSLSNEDARKILLKFKLLVTTNDLTDKIIELALCDNDFSDFEDAIQYYSAIENECHAIITRNQKDFKASKIPVMSAGEYLATK